jgi:hypothetical protein
VGLPTLFTPPWRSLLLLACLYVLLDCAKPLVIDDTAYAYDAHQIAWHPLDPYGHAIMWWDRPYTANEILAPPVLPSWWAVGVRLFGESPPLWKLWLLPVSLLFVWALHDLFRRFARGLEVPLTWMTVLSPVFLPGLNLMLDVPALALSLTAVILFLRACDRDALVLAALAGLVAGVAAQTKYTGFLAPAAMLLYALLHGKLRLWPVAVVPAVQVFVSWEFLTALLYGQSHFLSALRDSSQPLLQKAGLWAPLLGILGTVAAPVFLLGLAALRARAPVLVLGALLALLACGATACLGGTVRLEQAPFAPAGLLPLEFPLEVVVFVMLGLLGCLVLALVAARLCRLPPSHVPWWRRWQAHRDRYFLVLWLGLEVAGFFALTPFPAVRRVFGVVVVAALLAGRLASRTCRAPGRARLVHAVVGFSAALGLGFAALDFWEGWTEKALAESAAVVVRAQHDGGTVWFVGHWGFQYYAEQQGMRPVIPSWQRYEGERDYVPLPEASHFKEGDWLVIPDGRVTQQPLYVDPGRTEERFRLWVRDPVRLRTVICYYSGTTALTHEPEDTRLVVTVYRVTADFTAVGRR